MEEQAVKAKKGGKKELVGIVKSDRMHKTIVVAVETKTLHPLYKKYEKQQQRSV